MEFFFKKKTPPPTPTNSQPTQTQPITNPPPQPLNLFQSLNVKTNKPSANTTTPLPTTNIKSTNTDLNSIDASLLNEETKQPKLNVNITQPTIEPLEDENVEKHNESLSTQEENVAINNNNQKINSVEIVEESNQKINNSTTENNEIPKKEENIEEIKSTKQLPIVEKNMNDLNLIKENLEKKILNIKNYFDDLNLKKSKLNELINENLKSIKQYQEEQFIAAENENYELASNIEVKMNEISNENQKELESFYKLMKTKIDQDDNNNDNIKSNIIDFSSEEILLSYHQYSEPLLENLKIERDIQEIEFEKYQESIQEQLRSQRYEAQTRQDQIEREAKHLHLDKEILESDEKSLLEKVNTETQSFFDLREVALLKKVTCQREIDDLLKLVALKKEEQGQLDKEIDDIDNKIQNVRGKFSNEEKRIGSENSRILERESKIEEMRKEAANILEELAKLSNPTAENSKFSTLGQIKQCTEQHDKFISEYEVILDSAEEQSKQAKDLYDKMSHHFEQVHKMMDQLEIVQENINNLSNEISKQQKLKIELRNTITSIEDQIPQLEQSKNQAKDSKKFTEAANLLNEIKVLQQSQSEKKKLLQQTSDQHSTNTTSLSNLESDLNNLKEKIETENQNIYSLFNN